MPRANESLPSEKPSFDILAELRVLPSPTLARLVAPLVAAALDGVSPMTIDDLRLLGEVLHEHEVSSA